MKILMMVMMVLVSAAASASGLTCVDSTSELRQCSLDEPTGQTDSYDCTCSQWGPIGRLAKDPVRLILPAGMKPAELDGNQRNTACNVNFGAEFDSCSEL